MIKSPERTYTIAMSISGIKFPGQVAAFLKLLRAGFRPDIIMGSSGGCVTGALFISCGINNITDEESMQAFEGRLKKMLYNMCAKNYCTPWIYCDILNTWAAMVMWSVYNRGTGVDFINPGDIDLSKQPELWMGTHDKKTKKSKLFCTKREEETLLKVDGTTYLDDNVEDILNVVTASSAVPVIVPGVKIENSMYEDGGMSFASPLGSCIEPMEKCGLSYHVVYISPVRYSDKEDPHEEELEDDDVWNKMKAGAHGMVTGLHVSDRNNGIRHIIASAEGHSDKNVCKQIGVGYKALIECLERQKTAYKSFIEIAPLGEEVTVKFTEMQKGDAYKAVCRAYDNGFSVRHWYITDK